MKSSYVTTSSTDPAIVNAVVGALAGLGILVIIFVIIAIILEVIGLWKIFNKASQPGWAAIIPFYDYFVLINFF